MLNSREAASLDRHITGNYGEDQFRNQEDLAADVREERMYLAERYRSIVVDEYTEYNFVIPCYISVMMEDMAYGGPEEGGWWYTTVHRVESHFCQNITVLKKVLERVIKEYNNAGRPEISSVISRGRFKTILSYDPQPLCDPPYRPHYE